MAFDTEFVGEKYYKARLCIIAVATPMGHYIIDTMALQDLHPFLDLLHQPSIQKITHAGENDYRILVDMGARPRNVFDTQIAFAFLARHYPMSLANIVERELRIKLQKHMAVSDWEIRPLEKSQLEYAFGDVTHLPELADRIQQRLRQRGRLDWALDACRELEDPDYYLPDTVGRLFDNASSYSLSIEEKAWLWRLHQWRQKEAETRNCPERKILANDILKSLIRMLPKGKDVVLKDRRMPTHQIERHWRDLENIVKKPLSAEEKAFAQSLPKEATGDEEMDFQAEMVYAFARYRAAKEGIAVEMLITREEINRMKAIQGYIPASITNGWRKEVLGEPLLDWIAQKGKINLSMQDGAMQIAKI